MYKLYNTTPDLLPTRYVDNIEQVAFRDLNGEIIRHGDLIRMHVDPFDYDIIGYFVFDEQSLPFKLEECESFNSIVHKCYHSLERYSSCNDGHSTTKVTKKIYKIVGENV